MKEDDLLKVWLPPIPYLLEFRKECIKEDVEQRTKVFETDGKILGMTVALQITYTKPKLTAAEEAAIEKEITARRKSMGLE